MRIPPFTTREELNAWLTEIGQDPLSLSLAGEALDEMVHEVLKRQADAVTAGGITAQVDFLLATDGNNVRGLQRDLRDALQDDDEACFCGETGYLIHQEYGLADIPDGWTPVQRCDTCQRYEGDDSAATAAARDRGDVAVAFFMAVPDEDSDEDPPGDYAIEWIDPTGNFDPNNTTNPKGLT